MVRHVSPDDLSILSTGLVAQSVKRSPNSGFEELAVTPSTIDTDLAPNCV